MGKTLNFGNAISLPTGMGIVPDSESKILNRLAKESMDPLERERLRALYVLSMLFSEGSFKYILS